MDRLTGMGLFVAAVDESSLAAAARRFGMSAAMAGKYVAELPRYRAADLDLQAVYPSTRHIPLRVRRFIDCLVETFGNNPPWDQGIYTAKPAKSSR